MYGLTRVPRSHIDLCVPGQLWLSVNGLQGLWIYYCKCHLINLRCNTHSFVTDVRVSVDPNPRLAVNKTHGGYLAFEIMMYIFGSFLSFVNIGVFRHTFFNSPRSKYERKEW